jgi:hypothetical protein
VGNAAHLVEVGVAPMVHLPQVGENLQDHLVTAVSVSVRAAWATLSFWDLVSPLSLYNYGKYSSFLFII